MSLQIGLPVLGVPFLMISDYIFGCVANCHLKHLNHRNLYKEYKILYEAVIIYKNSHLYS
jgi:hypothetical protein